MYIYLSFLFVKHPIFYILLFFPVRCQKFGFHIIMDDLRYFEGPGNSSKCTEDNRYCVKETLWILLVFIGYDV